jgi:hypothetical protein
MYFSGTFEKGFIDLQNEFSIKVYLIVEREFVFGAGDSLAAL